jgi:hypothetical protein
MNCPHCGAPPSAQQVAIDDLDASEPELAALGDVLQNVSHLGRCTHEGAMRVGGNLWCPLCGALGSSEDGWKLPVLVIDAKEIDCRLASRGAAREASRADSDAKNVIPMKPRR